MAKTYNRLELDVNKKPNSIGIRPVQGDTKSRYLDVCLYENGVAIDLTGEQVRITFRKADGSTFFNQGEVTDATAGRCQFALTNEILSEAKALEAQISIWNAGGEILSTEVFEIYVSAAIPWTDAVESENEYGVLVVLFQEIQDALDTMHKIATTFGEPGDKAAEYGVDTFWGILETLAQRGDVGAAMESYIKSALNSTLKTQYFKTLDQMLSSKAGTAEFQPMDKYIHDLLTTETTVAAGRKEDIAKVVLKSDTSSSSSYGTVIDAADFVVEQTGVYLFYVYTSSTSNGYWTFLVDGETISHTNKYVLINLTKGQNVKIRGTNSYNNRTYSIGPVYYFLLENVRAKNSDSSYALTVTPQYSGTMMLLFSSKLSGISINGMTTSINCSAYDSGNTLYTALISVSAGVPMTISYSSGTEFCVASMDYQIETVSSFVKSIQRGIYYGTIGSGLTAFTIPIGAVNPARTYIDLPDYLYDGITIVDAKVVEDKLEVSCYATESRATYFRWQLVEFS